ncbi:hypothetical protein JCM10213_006815 [Rhodosporidiobolus nylandii]
MASSFNPADVAGSEAYYSLSLTPSQQALLSRLTPFRFRPAPSSTGSSASLVEPFLPLRSPSDLPLILTPPRPSDIPRQVECLNHPAVAFCLVGPPYPYAAEHAREWGATKGRDLEEYFFRLLEKLEAQGKAVEQLPTVPYEDGWRYRPDGCPCNSIRRADTGEWVGDLGTFRWVFEDVQDPEERERLAKENLARVAGDEELRWSFGFFLHPSYGGRGLMTGLLASHVSYLRGFLRTKHIHGAAFSDNIPSLRTQEKNGFVRYAAWTRQISEARGGGTKEVAVLKWQAGDGAEQ